MRTVSGELQSIRLSLQWKRLEEKVIVGGIYCLRENEKELGA